MINGAHVILYSTDADADRAFLQEVLELPFVDVGHSWLIFALPPAEVAVHPGERHSHELYLMCDDLEAVMAKLSARGVVFEAPVQAGWGRIVRFTTPGGSELSVYQPRHERPVWPG
ncbi:MAG: hypothetical protein JWR84_3589 [Caulobacter sp.]|nr:hypothetical protein [Caulobacter sp.]